MGKKQYKIKFFFIILFLLSFLVISCRFRKKISIIDCYIENEIIQIKLECENFSQKINEVILQNNDDYYVFEDEDICNVIDDEFILVGLKCAEKKIKINKEYRLSLRFSGGYAAAKIYFEDPKDIIEEVINILEKSSLIGR